MPELTHEDVQRILQIIDEMGDRDVHLEFGDLKLHVTRGGGSHNREVEVAEAAHAKPAPAEPVRPVENAVPQPEPPALSEVPEGYVAIRAPTVGTFYRASSPGAKPLVEVGDHVKPDDIVCVFDVMKLFSSISAGVAGTITAILVKNEALVQQDQPLILIKPD